MATIDHVELGKWERGETERGRCGRFLRGFWYNIGPKFFSLKLTPARLIFGTVRGLFFVAISLSPIWMKFIEGNSGLSWTEALLVSLILLALLGYNFAYDKFIRDAKFRTSSQSLRTRLSLEMCGTIKNLSERIKPKNAAAETEIR